MKQYATAKSKKVEAYFTYSETRSLQFNTQYNIHGNTYRAINTRYCLEWNPWTFIVIEYERRTGMPHHKKGSFPNCLWYFNIPNKDISKESVRYKLSTESKGSTNKDNQHANAATRIVVLAKSRIRRHNKTINNM